MALWFSVGAVTGGITLAVASTDPVGLANHAQQPQIAQRDGDDYVLSGTRHYLTQGGFADVAGVAGLFENDMHMFWVDTHSWVTSTDISETKGFTRWSSTASH